MEGHGEETETDCTRFRKEGANRRLATQFFYEIKRNGNLPLCLLVVLSNISMASSTCRTGREKRLFVIYSISHSFQSCDDVYPTETGYLREHKRACLFFYKWPIGFSYVIAINHNMPHNGLVQLILGTFDWIKR